MGLISYLKQKRSRILRFLLLGLLAPLIVLYVLNASTPGRAVQGCPSGCSKSVERKSGPMRVVSLNMLHGFPIFQDLDVRVDLIASEIQRLDADIVLLQEVPWTRSLGDVPARLADELGYNYLFLRANGNRKLIFFEEGEAILSRFPLEDIVHTELMPRVDLFQHRVVLGATTITPWGDMKVFVTHLTHSDVKANTGQVADLRAFVEANAPGMAIVAGDFNEKDNSPEIAELSRTWTDSFNQVHPGDVGLTCCIDNLHAGTGEPLEMRIDYIFLVHPTWRLVDSEHAFYGPFEVDGGWQWVSDHTGLMVELAP